MFATLQAQVILLVVGEIIMVVLSLKFTIDSAPTIKVPTFYSCQFVIV